MNAALEYSITSANTNLFAINPQTGEVTLKKKLDYETTTFHLVQISARDRGANPRAALASASLVVTVQDYNDNCPSFSKSSYYGNVSESAALNSQVMVFGVVDGDRTRPNNEILCSIDEPLVIQYFSVLTDGTRCRLTLKRPVDYEKIIQFRFVVKATDKGAVPCQMTANLIVSVLDIPDVIPTFKPTFYNVSIPESILTQNIRSLLSPLSGFRTIASGRS